MKFNQCNHFCPSCGGKKSPGAQHCRKCANSLFPPRKGAKLSKEVKQKIAHKLLGNIPWNKDKKGNQQAWNKGLTKETDIRIAAYSKNLMGIKKIVKKKMSDRQRQIIRERMFGDKNPSKRIEVRDKISKSLRRAFKNNPGILENRKRCGHNQYTDTYSNIEKIMADELVSRGIEFSHNFRVGRYFADFVVFGNTIIECDGEYWHSDKEKDRKRTCYLAHHGYSVFHFTESNIKKDISSCVDLVILNENYQLNDCFLNH